MHSRNELHGIVFNGLDHKLVLIYIFFETFLFPETIRKYPALPILNRECTIDYKIPNSELIIKKGTAIIISLLGLSRDPEYFPDPELYRPERFSDEVPQYNSDAYIPFGDGPRACIGTCTISNVLLNAYYIIFL